MCENSAVQTTIQNNISVGRVANDNASALTSLGHTDIANDAGFHGNGVKMSKDGKVVVVGSRQRVLLPNQPTNRPGLHIYLKKSVQRKGDEEPFKHFQTILFNDEDESINVNSVAISDDGSSIVVLGGFEEKFVYVFEQINKCTNNMKWVLQQTLVNENESIKWTGVQLDEKHRRLVLRTVDVTAALPTISTTYNVYERKRLAKKCSNASEDPLAYQFQHLQTIVPIFFDETASSVDANLFVVSHDAQTLIIIVKDVVGQTNNNHVVQYEWNCNDKIYEKKSDFLANTTNDQFTNATVSDVHFNGPCSDKLLLLIQPPDDAPYLVEVYSRAKSTQQCGGKLSNAKKCCSSDFVLFKADTLIASITDAAPDTTYTIRLIANDFDSNSFLTFETLCVFNDDYVNVKLRSRCKTDETVWCTTTLIDNQKSSGCVDLDEFGVLSFDETCGQYSYAFNRRIMAVPFGPFSTVYVNDPSGIFYFNVSNDATSDEIYFRVQGETQYTLYNKTGKQVLQFCKTDRCSAKLLELVLVQGPAPVDFENNDSLVKAKISIPIRTCFSVLSYTNFVK